MGHESVTATSPPALTSPPATSLAPGFRFHPTDEELVQYYLKRKACGKPFRFEAVSEIDVYKSEPWELSGHSRMKSRDLEWYFFSPIDRKYGNGSRLNRATDRGYWKATGKDRCVRHKGQTIGMKKTLVFHSGRAPDGKRTNWVMHEYRLADDEMERSRVAQAKDAFVLCRIFQKSGLGPPNGNRYAPFIEEDWDNDASLFVPGEEAADEMTNGDDTQVEGSDPEQVTYSINKAPLRGNEILVDNKNDPFVCKRERSEDFPVPCMTDPKPITFLPYKRPKPNDPNSNHANGSEGSTTTNQDRCISTTTKTTPNFSSALLEFPLLDSIEKENHHVDPPTFDAATLEKSVPPGYLKFISNLENEILNVSMERETLKIEVMRAQAVINILQSRIDLLTMENEEMKRITRDV